ncbi:MAG TPA: transcriptional repressor [Aliiroseovarius sp.]|nr:transcriptional repressor [Aliiroseovarius sp.]
MHDTFTGHDHAGCITQALARAEDTCQAAGARLTPLRRRVLEILLREHRAMGAYDVLKELVREGHGAQPPVAYRALDFLVEQGLAHRIERLNAFIACSQAGPDGRAGHAPVFLICRACGAVAEAQWQPQKGALGRAARAAGFRIDEVVSEALGLCPACQGAQEAAP